VKSLSNVGIRAYKVMKENGRGCLGQSHYNRGQDAHFSDEQVVSQFAVNRVARDMSHRLWRWQW
jgi:hypothetical protein